MRLHFTLSILLFTTIGFTQPTDANFIGPRAPGSLFFIPLPCPSTAIHTAMPFLGFGASCFEQSLSQIRVVAPSNDGLVNSDQNPALLLRPQRYQAAQVAITPWESGTNSNPNSSALKMSLQKQFLKGGSWSLRYENFSLQPILRPTFGFFATRPALGDLFRVAHARPLSSHWSLGFATKYARRTLSENLLASSPSTQHAWATDIGIRYQNTKVISASQKLNWQWGISLSNLGPKVQSVVETDVKQFLPSALGIGLLLEEEFALQGNALFRIRGAYQVNKLLVPNPCHQCDSNNNGIPDTPSTSTLRGLFSSLADSPDGFSGELREINHQFDMSLYYQFSARFAIHTKASLFYQHIDLGGVQYLTSQFGLRWGKIHFDMTYWKPNNTQAFITDRQLSLSIAYQHFL